MTARRGPYQTGSGGAGKIIDAASLVFARYGYAGASLRQIADDVGVTAAAFTRHFGNKEGLLQAVIDHWETKNDSFFDGACGSVTFVVSLSSWWPTPESRGSSSLPDAEHGSHEPSAPGPGLGCKA